MADENVEVEEVVESVSAEETKAEGVSKSSQTPPQNYLVMAILVTIFCCWPLGIPAIIFAAQVNSKFSQGDYAGAEDASKKAKMWSMISLIAGLVIGVLYFILMLVGAIAGRS